MFTTDTLRALTHGDLRRMGRDAYVAFASTLHPWSNEGIAGGDFDVLTAERYADDTRLSESFYGHHNALVAHAEAHPELLPPTPSEGKDRTGQGNALAIMRRREAQAIADRHQATQDLIAARVRVAELEEAVRNATHTDAAVSTPWGPDHPEWLAFWVRGALDAERAGNCGEYDRHAMDMGAPTRQDLRERGLIGERYYRHCIAVELTVTVHVDVTTSDEDGEGVDRYMVRNALAEWDGDVDALLRDSTIDGWHVEDSEADDDDLEARVAPWRNPNGGEGFGHNW